MVVVVNVNTITITIIVTSTRPKRHVGGRTSGAQHDATMKRKDSKLREYYTIDKKLKPGSRYRRGVYFVQRALLLLFHRWVFFFRRGGAYE